MQNSQKDFYKKLLGAKGERAVLKYLNAKGYKTVATNYKTPIGEADIIVKKDGVTYFVEVKTRTTRAFGDPKDAVNYKKIEKYDKIIDYYLLSHPDEEVAFAVAEVLGDEINVLFDAF